MHYSNLVIVKKVGGVVDGEIEGALKDVVAEAMGPSEEDGGFWDWYVIGGRWTGAFDGYDPSEDPANQEPCRICKGTGLRTDEFGIKERKENPDYKCNGCEGTGKMTKWPTEWVGHSGDVAPIESITEETFRKFYRIVTYDRGAFTPEQYRPWREELNEKFLKLETPPLDWLKKEYAGCLAVVVDNHS